MSVNSRKVIHDPYLRQGRDRRGHPFSRRGTGARPPGNAASQLSLRASTASKKSSNITPPPLIAVIGILAIVGGGIWVTVDDNSPDSP